LHHDAVLFRSAKATHRIANRRLFTPVVCAVALAGAAPPPPHYKPGNVAHLQPKLPEPVPRLYFVADAVVVLLILRYDNSSGLLQVRRLCSSPSDPACSAPANHQGTHGSSSSAPDKGSSRPLPLYVLNVDDYIRVDLNFVQLFMHHQCGLLIKTVLESNPKSASGSAR
ncbi:hypothetical protein EJB05_52700, partial [Eragrostis curvula]